MRFAVLAVLVAIAARPADACVPPDDQISDHELDPAHANDNTKPAAPTADYSIARREVGGGCTTTKTDCDGKYAEIYIDVVGSDDSTPANRLGYILTMTGDKPHGLYSRVQDGMPVFQPQGSLRYGFDFDDESFSFDVEIRTVDLNGNVSEPVVLHIEEHTSSGCSTAAPRSEWLLLPVLAFALRRRRRC